MVFQFFEFLNFGLDRPLKGNRQGVHDLGTRYHRAEHCTHQETSCQYRPKRGQPDSQAHRYSCALPSATAHAQTHRKDLDAQQSKAQQSKASQPLNILRLTHNDDGFASCFLLYLQLGFLLTTKTVVCNPFTTVSKEQFTSLNFTQLSTLPPLI